MTPPQAADAIQTLKSAADEFMVLAQRLDGERAAQAFHEVVAVVHRLSAAAARCDAAGVPVSDVRNLLAEPRAVHRESPFIAHLQTWPRGYVGDFEAVERLLFPENRCRPGTIAHWLEHYALTCAVAQQHRNKVARQSRLILERIHAAPTSTVRILSLAAGGSPDIANVSGLLGQTDARFVVVDLDPEAIALSRSRLDSISERVTFLEQNVFKCFPRVRALGPFDLVMAGGLFDYLSKRQAQFLIDKVTRTLLVPGGVFFLTNIADGNPYRYWIDYLADWTLVERSEQNVLELFAMCSDVSVDISRDETNLTLFVPATKGILV